MFTNVYYCIIWFVSVDGAWSEWHQWGACSIPCGGSGTRMRFRTCTNPEPQYGGNACEGDLSENGECGTESCNGELVTNLCKI